MKLFSTICLFFALLISFSVVAEDVVVDSQMSFDEAIKGTTAPKSVIKTLAIVDVEYYSFDNKLHRGQIVVHKDVVNDIKEVFALIKSTKFPIQSVIPIVRYNWNDDSSCADNNTSAFCYRKVAGSNKMSNHAYGLAIDINPFNNPFKSKKGRITPPGASYDTTKRGTLSQNSVITQKFLSIGWKWGGNYQTIKDWQHFDKE